MTRRRAQSGGLERWRPTVGFATQRQGGDEGEPLAALLEVVHGADTFSDPRSSATTAVTAAGEPLEDRYGSET